jgi:hypothetical protein
MVIPFNIESKLKFIGQINADQEKRVDLELVETSKPRQFILED